MSIEPENTPDRILTIEALRFIAALLVVFHHCRLQATFFDGSFNFGQYIQGHTGVDIFFVISGFIMVWVTRKRDRHPIPFIAGRFLRVWPLYAIFTALAGYLAFFWPAWYAGPADLEYILRSMFFRPTQRPEPFGGLWPILVPGWTLNLEMVFYLIFGVALFFRRTALIASVGLIIVYAISWANASTYTWAAAYSFFGGVILEFIIGMAIAWRFIAGDRLPGWVACLLIVVGFVLLFFFVGKTGSSLVDSGVPAAMIVLSAINLRLDRLNDGQRKAILLLGALSYPMYLSHNFIIQALTRLLRKLGFEQGSIHGLLFLAAVAVLVFLASWLVHAAIEKPIGRHVAKPLVKALDTLVNRERTSAAAA